MAQKVKRYSPQEYYALEREATYKSDYYDGDIFEIWPGPIGESPMRHGLIASNLVRGLGYRLKGKPCSAYGSIVRIQIKATDFVCYSDVGIYCGDLERDLDDPKCEAVTNPTVLLEVLSNSTEGFDRGFKAGNYRQIKSLRAYIFVSQTAPQVEVYQREEDGDWKLHEVKGLSASVVIPGIGVTLPMGEIYERVAFGGSELMGEEDEKPVRPD